MRHRVPSIEKAHAASGWEPQLNLDMILADVLKHARTAPIALSDAEALDAV